MFSQHFCTSCLDMKNFDEIFEEEIFNIKGEEIKIISRFLQCECGKKILDPNNVDENFAKAYDEYRKRKNLLQPSEIIKIREMYGLSQRQLAKILGWSHATLSRYETGAIQSVSHNNVLVLIRENPANLLKLLENNKHLLSASEYQIIKEYLEIAVSEQSASHEETDLLNVPKQMYQKLFKRKNKIYDNEQLIYFFKTALMQNELNNVHELKTILRDTNFYSGRLNNRLSKENHYGIDYAFADELEKNIREKRHNHSDNELFEGLDLVEKNIKNEHKIDKLASLIGN
ncbi:type II TA system antitoxin MqsA family protein [Bacillus subtilis]|uniref:type II TA system antitoxin MqsA family protein n=1 Tax=Bacillus subtilis TaxID=1423 RepID=UPI0027957A65|nr:type II TA system antitoxin MqsA family protein [Bacillus subtilis]